MLFFTTSARQPALTVGSRDDPISFSRKVVRQGAEQYRIVLDDENGRVFGPVWLRSRSLEVAGFSSGQVRRTIFSDHAVEDSRLLLTPSKLLVKSR